MTRLRLRTAALAVLAFAALGVLSAPGARGAGLEVYPLFSDLDATPGETAELRIANTFEAPAAFSISAVRRSFDANGVERPPEDAGGDFVIFPPQILIPAGGAQIVRLQWTSTAPLDATAYYDIVFEQLPLSLDNADRASPPVALSILVNVRARLYVNPPGSRAEISLGPARIDSGEIVFDASNAGTRYHLLREGTLSVACAGRAALELSGEDVITRLGGSLVREGTTRTFRMQAPSGCRSPTVTYEDAN